MFSEGLTKRGFSNIHLLGPDYYPFVIFSIITLLISPIVKLSKFSTLIADKWKWIIASNHVFNLWKMRFVACLVLVSFRCTWAIIFKCSELCSNFSYNRVNSPF